MAEVINLRLVRKARARANAAAKGAANRAKFGQTKVQRAQQKAESERSAKVLDGARRETED